jgi:hypothetical protein
MLIGGRDTLTRSYRRSGGDVLRLLAGNYSIYTEPGLLKKHHKGLRT